MSMGMLKEVSRLWNSSIEQISTETITWNANAWFNLAGSKDQLSPCFFAIHTIISLKVEQLQLIEFLNDTEMKWSKHCLGLLLNHCGKMLLHDIEHQHEKALLHIQDKVITENWSAHN